MLLQSLHLLLVCTNVGLKLTYVYNAGRHAGMLQLFKKYSLIFVKSIFLAARFLQVLHQDKLLIIVKILVTIVSVPNYC